LLANKQIPYEERLKKICDDKKMSEKEKNSAKTKLLDDLGLVRYCCRMRILGYIRLINIIK